MKKYIYHVKTLHGISQLKKKIIIIQVSMAGELM
jgi:hypothetical protein